MNARPWSEAHIREAAARTYELVAELVRDQRMNPAAELLEGPWLTAQSEEGWRADLSCGFDVARIDREVARVRALAEGRLVREPGVRIAILDGTGERRLLSGGEDAPAIGDRIVRVTRIRRPA